MSHYTVAVLCNSVEEIDQRLAPFVEHNENEGSDQYFKFIDKTDEVLEAAEQFYQYVEDGAST